MHDNKLQTVLPNLRELIDEEYLNGSTPGKALNLAGNPLICDERLGWIKEIDQGLTMLINSKPIISMTDKCNQAGCYGNRTWESLSLAELLRKPCDFDKWATDLTGYVYLYDSNHMKMSLNVFI